MEARIADKGGMEEVAGKVVRRSHLRHNSETGTTHSLHVVGAGWDLLMLKMM